LVSWQFFVEKAHLVIDLWRGPVSVFLILGGGAFLAFALLVEFLLGLKVIAGRRSAVGANVAVPVLPAPALLVIVNAFSAGLELSSRLSFVGKAFQSLSPHKLGPTYRVFDWTRDRRFTLPEGVREELAKLQGETTVVVYQRHKTFGGLTDK